MDFHKVTENFIFHLLLPICYLFIRHLSDTYLLFIIFTYTMFFLKSYYSETRRFRSSELIMKLKILRRILKLSGFCPRKNRPARVMCCMFYKSDFRVFAWFPQWRHTAFIKPVPYLFILTYMLMLSLSSFWQFYKGEWEMRNRA